MLVLPRRYDGVHFRIADLACIGYTLLIGVLLLFFHSTVADWKLRLAAHLLLAIGFAEIARAANLHSTRSRIVRVFRTLYPLVLLLLAWNELNAIVSMIYGGSFWTTDIIVRSEQVLFGGHPTVLIQAWHRPWLDEAMAIMYTGYYLFLAVPIVLLLQRKNEAALAASSVIALTYAVNFTLFLLLPTKSPAHILADYPGLHASGYTGYLVAAMTRSIQTNESVLGAAFPSSHVAGSFVCALLARRYLPRFGNVLLPLSFGVAIATVYLGYHHALDPIFGLLLGGAVYVVGLRWLQARGEDPLA